MLHAVGDEGLQQLPAVGLVEIEEHVAGGLHGDGAGALGLVARDEIDQYRACHAQVVDAVVLEEALVLGGEEGVLDQLRNLVVSDRDSPLLTDLGDESAAAGVDAQRHLQFDVAHHLERGERRHEIDIAAGERVGAKECHERRAAKEYDEQTKPVPFHRKPPLLSAPANTLRSKTPVTMGTQSLRSTATSAVESQACPATLTHSDRRGHAPPVGSDASAESSSATVNFVAVSRESLFCPATALARAAPGSPGGPRRT